jgi:TetR/AcrR family transcriptional regulator, acrAB operon repressor
MARKTKEEADKTRTNILYTALNLFFEKGYARTSLDDIASACGITRGAIYWHFKDKADLFLTLGQHLDEEAKMNYSEILENTKSLEGMISEIGNYLAQFEENEDYWKFYSLVNYKTEWNEELEPVLSQHREELRDLVRALGQTLARLKAEGRLRSNINAEETALATWAFIEGLVGMWFLDPGLFSLKHTGTKLVGDYLRQFSS